MKKSKITISIFAAVCVVSAIVGYSLIKQNKNHKYDQIAVMLKQDDGTYIKSNMSAFGNNEYKFDHAVCNNGTTVTANSNGGVNLKLLGADKCTVYLKPKTVIDKIKVSAQPSTNLNYGIIEPSNTTSSIITTDDNFNKEEQTFTVDTTHKSYYITYAYAYTFNVPTNDFAYPSYTLTSAQIAKYSDIYGSLAGKYVVNYEGHNSSTKAISSKIDRIYKIVKATSNSITYIPSSYTMEFTNSTTGIYIAKDDYGTSYYFRGNVTDNYVKFGKWTEEVYRGYNSDQSAYKDFFTKEECQSNNQYYIDFKNQTVNNGCNKSPVAGKDMYWRIVRINGDGTLRLMYDGTEAYANGTKSLDRFAIQYQKFNTSINNNAYVGYMYGDINGTTYAAVHANTNDSLIKTALEKWYEKNFVGTEYESKIGDMLFCNDRSLVSGTGIGTTYTEYRAWERLQTNKNPDLICTQKEDKFTKYDLVKGNGKLTYPVGLLTADEAALAGGSMSSSGYTGYNRGFYINKGYDSWLGSPTTTNGGSGGFYVSKDGLMYTARITDTYGVDPVINLSAEYTNRLKGSGTMEDPYTVE